MYKVLGNLNSFASNGRIKDEIQTNNINNNNKNNNNNSYREFRANRPDNAIKKRQNVY
jgi:hypothetical protein